MSHQYTELEKRLIVASDLGITIQHMDGHRYIICTSGERDFVAAAGRHDVNFSGKVYGSLTDALDRIDFIRTKMKLPTLAEQFHRDFDHDRSHFMKPYSDENLITRHETPKDHEQSVASPFSFDPHYMG